MSGHTVLVYTRASSGEELLGKSGASNMEATSKAGSARGASRKGGGGAGGAKEGGSNGAVGKGGAGGGVVGGKGSKGAKGKAVRCCISSASTATSGAQSVMCLFSGTAQRSC